MLETVLNMELKHALTIFITAMTPVLELRGSIPYGAANDLPFWETMLLSILGNIILTPFIVLFTRKMFFYLKKIRLFRRVVDWSERHVMKKQDVIKKYEAVGLAILVAIPLPGTGAWTGAMLAGFLDMRLKRALPPIIIGVIIAAFLVGGVSYGFLGAMDYFGLHK